MTEEILKYIPNYIQTGHVPSRAPDGCTLQIISPSACFLMGILSQAIGVRTHNVKEEKRMNKDGHVEDRTIPAEACKRH